MPLFLLLLAVAPGAFWLWYFWHRDRLEPEPREVVLRVFFLGVAAALPLAMLEAPVPKPWDLIVAAPIIEELGKFLVVYLFIYRQREFDEPMDGIVYGVAAALGFATIENILYVLQQGAGVGVARALLSVPGHALWGCVWGYALGRAKFMRRGGTGLVVACLALAMVCHGLFNFGCSGRVEWLLVAPPLLILFGALVARQDLREALRRAPLRRDALPPPGLPGPHQPPPLHPPHPQAPPPPPNDDRWKGL